MEQFLSYAHEFAAAVARSKEFGLSAPQFELAPTRRWFDTDRLARFPYVMRDGLGELAIQDLMSQCMSIHFRMRSVVQDWLDCPVMYTLGWIDDGTAHGMFKFDDAFITKMLRTGHKGGTVNLHAWLTLPSMEIIDVSLATTVGIAQKRPEMLGLAITRPADELTGMAYKPMLVGDDFLRKTGLLIEW